MKQIILLFAGFALLALLGHGQEVNLPVDKVKKHTPVRNVEIGLGYIPKSEYNALRLTGAVNNLLWKAIGFYTTFDKGLDSDYFANLIGASVSIIDEIVVYGGFDFFTKKHGMIEMGITDCRKEIGIAVYPYTGLAIRGGYSGEAGFHFGVGWRFPIAKKSAADESNTD